MRGSRAALAVAWACALATAIPAGAGGRLYEKDVNLAIARSVAVHLRDAGVDVTMTRERDETLQPSERTGLANRLGVDAFVSIHNNASRAPAVSGSEVYRSIRGDGSRALGAAIHRALAFDPGRRNVLLTRRGCCGDYYFQLRWTRMPAVIVEGAYLSNPGEARRLADPGFRDRIARAIADGVLAFQRTLDARRAPRLDPGTRVPGPLPPPLAGEARALGATRVDLRWSEVPAVERYRVYRDGRLIAERRRTRLTDVWAAPGQRYAYEVRAVREAAPGLFAESIPLHLEARTPAISVVLDPGHGGRDPGAIAQQG